VLHAVRADQLASRDQGPIDGLPEIDENEDENEMKSTLHAPGPVAITAADPVRRGPAMKHLAFEVSSTDTQRVLQTRKEGAVMADGTTKRSVVILNSRQDFIDSLQAGLEAKGFETAGAHVADIQSGALDLLTFIHEHKPTLIVYDLPRPYEQHWNFLRLLKDTHVLKRAIWVLATTDKRALEAAVGASGVVEIIFGEPYGVEDVVTAVCKSFPE
jgi:CheY-like chemotaxis protein